MKEHPVILFDGLCNLCDGAVRFIIRRDPEGLFRFAAMESPAGRRILERHGVSEVSGETMILIEGGEIFMKSSAAFRIARRLSGAWPLIGRLSLLPRPFRDGGYDLIARNRFRWFGRKTACPLPSEDDRGRFLD